MEAHDATLSPRPTSGELHVDASMLWSKDVSVDGAAAVAAAAVAAPVPAAAALVTPSRGREGDRMALMRWCRTCWSKLSERMPAVVAKNGGGRLPDVGVRPAAVAVARPPSWPGGSDSVGTCGTGVLEEPSDDAE